MLDTCVADDRLFNYRFELCFDDFEYPHIQEIRYYYNPFGLNTPQTKPSFDSTLRLSMKHIFCFGIYRNNFMRVWIGPSISATFYPQINMYYSYIHSFSNFINYAYSSFLNPGFEIGVNYNLNELLSLTTECGVTYEWKVKKAYQYGDEIRPLIFKVSFGVLFRINESSKNKNIKLQEISYL